MRGCMQKEQKHLNVFQPRIVREACVSGLGSVWPVFKGATSKIWPEFKASSKNVERSISLELFCLLSAGSRGASGPIAYRIVSARTATLDHRGRNRGQRVSAPLGSAAAQWTRPDTTVEPDTASKTGGSQFGNIQYRSDFQELRRGLWHVRTRHAETGERWSGTTAR